MSAPGDLAEPRVMSGQIWEELCDALREAVDLVAGPEVAGAELERAAGLEYLTQFLAAGINLCVAHADPDHPRLTRQMDLGIHWGLDSPDCLYLFASLRGDAMYRLWGDPGTANQLDIQVSAGHPGAGRIEAMRTIGSINRDELARGPDGSIELVLGGPERSRNWLAMAPDASMLQIRQNFYDWESERPAELFIERVGGPVTRPPTRTDQIGRRLDLLRSWLSRGGPLWERLSGTVLEMEPNSVVKFAIDPGAEHAGLKGQIHCRGNFQCTPDEAVILELRPPPCRHWSVSLANRYWQSIDFSTRQSSLNGHQAQLDADGVFRAVIAARDPGVPNWLDTGGHEQGTIFGRFILTEGDLGEPSTRRVKLAAVRGALPPETAAVTPDQREELLRRRRDACLRRYHR